MIGMWQEYRGHAKNTKFYAEVVNKAPNATFKVAYSKSNRFPSVIRLEYRC